MFYRCFRNPQSSLCHINQQRLSIVLGTIVISFIISYGPFYISQMLREFDLFPTKHQKTMVYVSILFQVMTYINSCVNPVLYSSFTRKFMLIKDLTPNEAPQVATDGAASNVNITPSNALCVEAVLTGTENSTA